MSRNVSIERQDGEPTEWVREQLNGESVSKSFLAIVERLDGKGANAKVSALLAVNSSLSRLACPGATALLSVVLFGYEQNVTKYCTCKYRPLPLMQRRHMKPSTPRSRWAKRSTAMFAMAVALNLYDE